MSFLADPLGQLMAALYSLVPNIGLAIILLTVLVNLVLFPLTLKQTRSMRAMQEVQPEVKRIQREFKDDRAQLQQELMKLYKERGINPAAGCLPMLVQLPIWISLFSLLSKPLDHLPVTSNLAAAFTAQRTGFLGMDLTLRPSGVIQDGLLEAAPYMLLIALIVLTGIFQQRQATTRSAQSGQELTPQMQQTQAIFKFLPIVFGLVSWTLLAGVDLYILAGNVFRIGQQTLIYRLDDLKRAGDGDSQARAAEGPSSQASQPAPASPPGKNRKKRKKRK